MGSNKGASQSGMTFGAKREIGLAPPTAQMATPMDDGTTLASPFEKLAPGGGVC